MQRLAALLHSKWTKLQDGVLSNSSAIGLLIRFKPILDASYTDTNINTEKGQRQRITWNWQYDITYNILQSSTYQPDKEEKKPRTERAPAPRGISLPSNILSQLTLHIYVAKAWYSSISNKTDIK